ncbi:MAG: YebC/PmpR family DNA-binding transcriptional regulator, partial [Bacillota bacterium]
LKIAIQKAKAANMPNDNINRAIQRGAGGQDSNNYEELVYEGYGPGGVAVMINVLTDNRNRTAGEIRHIFSKNGGNMGETGCVGWMFEKKGVLVLEPAETNLSEDDLILLVVDKGAEDIKFEEEEVQIITAPEEFQAVKEALEKEGLSFTRAELAMIPQNTVEIKDLDQAKLLLRMMDYLEEHDDVQDVYANFDIPDDIMEQLQ